MTTKEIMPAILIPTLNPETGRAFESEEEKLAYKESQKQAWRALREERRGRQEERKAKEAQKEEVYAGAIQKFNVLLTQAGLTDEEILLLFDFEGQRTKRGNK